MNSNPYAFSNVDDPTQNTDAMGRACPELFEVIRIKGSLSKSEALRMAAKCKAIPRSSFSSEADWQAARRQIEAFVTPRKIEDFTVPE